MGQPVCNLCGATAFEPFRGRADARCAGCGALERTRVLGLVLDGLDWGGIRDVLHLAPEQGLYDAIRRRNPRRYVTADADPGRYPFAADLARLDLCRLEDEPEEQYDLILHSHVLEHVPCPVAVPLYHLHRMLRPGGMHVMVIPFRHADHSREDYAPMTDAERTQRFGQSDHVRIFGAPDAGATLGRVIRLAGTLSLLDRFGADTLRRHAIPERCWSGLTPETPLVLRRADYLLAKWS